MSKIKTIQNEWALYFEEVSKKRGFFRLQKGDVGLPHYKEVLKQIYYHARENPQIQALATAYFRGDQRNQIKNFYRHAISEIGHDQLALNDLKVLGEDVSKIPTGRPLPATTALLSFPFFQIQYGNPLGYLGYLFHLEFMPTQNGQGYIDYLKGLGIPRAALSFIEEHSQVDVIHNKWMEEYVEELVRTQEDVESVIYAAQVTAYLYCEMIHQAFEQADNPKLQWGYEPREIQKINFV